MSREIYDPDEHRVTIRPSASAGRVSQKDFDLLVAVAKTLTEICRVQEASIEDLKKRMRIVEAGSKYGPGRSW